MRNGHFARLICTLLCAVPLLIVQTFAHAGVIGAEHFLSAVDRQLTIGEIDAVLARGEVRAQLELHGVDPAEATTRVAALNDQELVELAENLETLPAGGSALGTIGVVFIVLLILELVGVIDIFKSV
jgi:hypothetical protein